VNKKRKKAFYIYALAASFLGNPGTTGTWDLRDGNYFDAKVLQNVNAHKELQQNCKTYGHKFYTV